MLSSFNSLIISASRWRIHYHSFEIGSNNDKLSNLIKHALNLLLNLTKVVSTKKCYLGVAGNDETILGMICMNESDPWKRLNIPTFVCL